MVEKNDPNKVNPSPNWDDDGKDRAQNVFCCWLLKQSGDTDKDFRDPSDKWDEKKKKLDDSGLFVKPRHYFYLRWSNGLYNDI